MKQSYEKMSVEELEDAIEEKNKKLLWFDNSIRDLKNQRELWEEAVTILTTYRSKLNPATQMSEMERVNEQINELQKQLRQLDNEEIKLYQLRDALISERDKMTELRDTLLENPESQRGHSNIIRSRVYTNTKRFLKNGFQTAKKGFKTAKGAVSKVNPFEKKIDKNQVHDTGVESIRLANQTIKQAKSTIKTVDSTIKTTNRTVKTAGKTVKTAVKVAYKTPIYIVKGAVGVVRFTANAAVNIVAAVTNPVVLIIALILMVIIMLFGSVLMLLVGGASAASSNALAHGNAAGLVDVPDQYQAGVGFFNTAVQKKRDAFYALIDGMYYNYSDLTHSDLCYMVCTKVSGATATYDKSYATDGRKTMLKSEWIFNSLTELEANAIAYVYLEKKENDAHGTEGGIYEVTYTQDVFDEIIEKCVTFNDSIYPGQDCPPQNCTEVPNPAWTAANDAVILSADQFNDWMAVCGQLPTDPNAANWWIVKYNRYPTNLNNNGGDFLDVLGAEYEANVHYRDSLPLTIRVCQHSHNLHSIGLWYYDKEYVMNALGFSDNDKQWESLTEMGFVNNPDIP